MSSGSLVDLDPSALPERRWPFYVAWTVGGAVIAAVLLGHLPASRRGPESVVQPTSIEAPAAATTAPARP